MPDHLRSYSGLAFAVLRTAIVTLALSACVAAHAHPGRGINIDASGQVYVADAVRSVVWRLAPDGRVEAAAREVHAHWLVLDANGAVLADHVHYDAQTKQFLRGLVRIDRSGRTATLIEARADPEGLDAGAFALHGEDLYIARESMPAIEIRRAGRVIRSIAVPAADQPINSLAVDASGAIVAVRGRELLRIGSDNAVHVVATLPLDSGERVLNLRALWGLALRADGIHYTTDPGLRRVLALDADGASRIVHTAEPPWFPTGVAARGSQLFVLEHGFARDANLGPRVVILERGRPPQVLGTVSE